MRRGDWGRTIWPPAPVLLALSTVLGAPGQAQSMPPTLTQFLQQTIGLHQDDLTAVGAGKAVVRMLESPDRREIVAFGIVAIAVPRTFYVQRVSDFRSSLRMATRKRFVIFSDPAVAADVATLSVPHDDVQDLARCRAGACKVKLSAETIARVRAVIDSDPAEADSVASRFLRKRMIDYVTGYRARGNQALVVYADEDSIAAAAGIFDAIVSRSPYMYRYAPTLEQYLEHYPQDRPADLSEILFWSEDDLPGLQPTVSITHEVVYAPPELPGCTLIAAKQLYADHYLDGALSLTAVVDQSPEQAGAYVIFLRRLHFDELPSGGLLNIRGKVTGKLRDQTGRELDHVKTTTERAYTGATPSPR